jgi:hypothetical protein
VVRGTLAFDEDGYRWKEHLLDGSTAAGERRHWLSVEEGEGGLELVLWDRLPAPTSPPTAEVASTASPTAATSAAGRATPPPARPAPPTRDAGVRRLPARGRRGAAPVVRALSSRRVVGGQHGRVVLAESLTILHS